jgi:HSP20 family protein
MTKQITRPDISEQLTRWDPFRELEDFQSRLSSFFSPSRRDELSQRLSSGVWAPPVDITEDDKEYLIKVELPEIKKEDVKVRVENGMLFISGERKRELEEQEKGKRFHRIERSYGSFVRSFAVPDDADPSRVCAEFRDGMLYVCLPKSPDAKPKQIDVQVK